MNAVKARLWGWLAWIAHRTGHYRAYTYCHRKWLEATFHAFRFV